MTLSANELNIIKCHQRETKEMVGNVRESTFQKEFLWQQNLGRKLEALAEELTTKTKGQT